jgi:hypothetical protein
MVRGNRRLLERVLDFDGNGGVEEGQLGIERIDDAEILLLIFFFFFEKNSCSFIFFLLVDLYTHKKGGKFKLMTTLYKVWSQLIRYL